MDTSTMIDVSLPDEAKAVIWRIFGAGESPRTEPSTFDLIERVICSRHVSSSAHRTWAISEIRGWFETIGNRHWLKPEVRESVAVLILEGIGADRSETAVWAIGSIDSELAASIIRSRWRPEEIESFVDAVLATLETICARDEILDAAGIVPFAEIGSGKAHIPKDAVQRDGRLETFRYLHSHGFDLLHRALRPAVGKLIELVVDLKPERFESLIERLDHPVVQARAAYHMVGATVATDHRKPLLWISEDSCDSLIALAIVHALEAVNSLDEDIRSFARLGKDRSVWSTELHPPQDDLDAAAVNLLNDLVGRLVELDSLAGARWIGELLSGAPYILMRGGDFEKPPRIDQLERIGVEKLTLLVRHSWSDGLPAALCAGLRLTPRETWTRHLADVAWEIHDIEPAPAATLARAALDELERHITAELERGHLFLNWSDWHDREWIAALGAALVLSTDQVDLPEWVSTRCRALPLSVWDAEETYETFSIADRAAQIWFLVALHAVACLKQRGCVVDPVEVRILAETVWAHCYFTGQCRAAGADASVAAEHAARTAVEFGEPSDLWLLEQAHCRRVGPRALWALVDQKRKRAAREGLADAGHDEMLIPEVVRAASNRFDDGGQFDLESLHYWGHLWLLLGAAEQASRTAKAIIAFPTRGLNRGSKILVLKLLALGGEGRGLDLETWEYIGLSYRELWPTHGYTRDVERADRQQIDKLLERSGLSGRRAI